MKIWKITGIVVLLLIIVPLIIAAFMPMEYLVSRRVLINRPAPEVFAFVKLLKNQPQYSKWMREDPNVKITYRGTDGEVGSVMAWESDVSNVGKGEQEVKQLVDGKEMVVELRFEKPYAATEPATTLVEAKGENQTEVSMKFDMKFPYPMNLLCMGVPDMVGKDMQTTLDNLKGVLEQPVEEQPAPEATATEATAAATAVTEATAVETPPAP